MKHNLRCEGFRPFRRNTLLGFAEVIIPDIHLRIKDIAVHQKGDARWAALPAKPQVKDGVVIKDADGKAQYVAILEFTSRTVRDAFSAAVLDAVLARDPHAFDDE